MGMLGRIANAVGTAAETIGTMKLKQISEEELLDKKAALEEAREQRILEAQEASKSKWHDIERGEKLSDEVAKYQREDDPNTFENKFRKAQIDNMANSGLLTQAQIEKAKYDLSQAKDPNSIENKAKQAQIDSSLANANQSNAATSRYTQETNLLSKKESLIDAYKTEQDPEKRNEILANLSVLEGKDPYSTRESQLKYEDAKELSKLKHDVINGTPEEQATAIEKINQLSGKEKTIIKTAKVQFGVDSLGNPIMGDALYREGKDGKVQWINPQDELKKANSAMGMSDADIEALAIEMTDKQVGIKDTGKIGIPFVREGTSGNEKEYDDALAANKVKVKSGMLNSGKDIPSNMKTGDDVKDTTLRVIMLNESSGNPTAQNRDKPGNTAGGLFQLTDATAKELGAVVGKDGKISYEEKNRMAKIFYDTAYRKYGDDVPKILGAGFAPNGVAEAVKKAEIAAQKDPSIDPSTDWIQFGGESIQNNKAEIIDRTRQVIGELAKKDIEIPISLSRFYNRNRKRA